MTADITEIKRFAVHDGDGIRTTVFFSGCPLRCLWCHNPETFDRKAHLMFYRHKCTGCRKCAKVCACHTFDTGEHGIDRERCVACGRCADVCPTEALAVSGRKMTVEEITKALLPDREFYENSGGGITLSGGECLLQPAACIEILREMREAGIDTAVDTCGYVSQEVIRSVMPHTTTFLYDMKVFDEKVHVKCTGKSNKIILENLKFLLESGARVEIRYPYVPGYNDGEAEAIASFLSALPPVVRVRVLPYHNYVASKYAALGMGHPLSERLPTKEEISRAEATFRRYGIPCGEE